MNFKIYKKPKIFIYVIEVNNALLLGSNEESVSTNNYELKNGINGDVIQLSKNHPHSLWSDAPYDSCYQAFY